MNAHQPAEEVFLLRLPDDLADQVRQGLHAGVPLDLGLVLGPEPEDGKKARTGTFRLGEEELSATLTSLPTVIETQKSLDSVTFYQTSANGTGTVRQVIDVSREADALPIDAEQPNGLTPPMLDVRNRKWRKRQPRKKEAIEQVALELEALLRGGPPKPEFELVEEEVVSLSVRGGRVCRVRRWNV